MKTATRQEVTDLIVRAWQAMKKKELIKSFQVCALIESNPSMVRKDDVVRQALEEVQVELVQDWKNMTVRRTLLLILYQRTSTCKILH